MHRVGKIIKISRERLVSPFLMWLIVVVGIWLSLRILGNFRILPRNMFTPFLFLLTLVYWLCFLIGAVKINRQVARSVAGISRIIKDGVYGIVRHPIYSADIVLSWGIFSFWPTVGVLGSVIWLTLVQCFWMSLEERFLIKKFGSEYKDYQKEVPMFIPKLRL